MWSERADESSIPQGHLLCLASLAVKLIEPLYARTIKQGATHSYLQNFYTELYRSLSTLTVSSEFLTFDQPTFSGVSQELLDGMKKSYGETILQTMMQVGQEHEDDVVLLVNYFLPELANTIAKQRRCLWLSKGSACNYWRN